jgi:DNA-binding beta-propeller fold protein YncE
MRGWARLLGLVVAAGALVSGCHSAANVAITMTPASATVLVGATAQFTATSSNGAAVNWSVNGVANGNTSLGTVSSSGLYTAPLSVPFNTTTTPPTPTAITVTATLQTDSTITASATVTLDSGVRVSITPTSFTLGTGEAFQFTAAVTGVPPNASAGSGAPCNPDSAPPSGVPYCNSVTWSVTPTTNAGTVSPKGNYSAAGATAGTTALVTATSIFDTTRTASANVSIDQATPPTLTSVNPTTAARGALLQDVYLTGKNFLSTTGVYWTDPGGAIHAVPSTNVIVPQPGLTTPQGSPVGTLIHVRLSDQDLTTPPVSPATSAALTFSVAQQVICQNGNPCPPPTQIACTTPPNCTLSLAPVRPAIVGVSPDSIPQGTGSPVAFNVNGGFFGTAQTPTVTATFAGTEAKFPAVSSANSTRQLTVTIGGTGSGADVTTPGLFPIAITSNVDPSKSVVTNVAIQPSYPPSAYSSLVQFTTTGTGGNVGTTPAAVAINATTGMAVVANQGSNDVELIDLTKTTPAVVGFICVGTSGATLTPTESGTCPAAGPASVAIDNVYNVALVSDAGTSSISVVDLNLQKTTAVVAPCPSSGQPPPLCVPLNTGLTPPAPFVPGGIGINPVNHLGILTYQSTDVASIIFLTPPSPASFLFAGVVNISTGPNTRVAVSPRLDWAVVTPGGLGSLSIVDLARQSTNAIAPSTATSPGASRTSGIVTITTTTAQNLQVGEPVLVSGVADPSFDGIYAVYTVPSSTSFSYLQTTFSQVPSNATSGGGVVSYGFPVATLASNLTVQGVALNDQTQKAILTDPGGTTPGTVFSVLDQSSTTIPLPGGNLTDGSNNLAVAVNPLANLAVTVNQNTGDAFLIDPSGQSVLKTIPGAQVGTNPVDVAIDPGTDIAVFVNQGAPASINIFSLGALRPLQVLETSVAPTPNQPPPQQPCPTTAGPIVSGPSVLVCSTLSAPASLSAVPQTLTIIGSGFTPGSVARLDGTTLQTTFVSSREITAVVPTSFQSVARRFSLDVADSGAVSNSTSFTVVQSVNLAVGNNPNCTTPAPQGVAIDANLDEALVTDSGLGCKQVYLINLATSAVQTVAVGTNPQGVAVFPRLGVAVVANEGDNTAMVVNETPGNAGGTLATRTTDSGPAGVAIDQDLGEALVAASGGNVADQISISGSNAAITVGSSSGLTVQQQPASVAVDSVTHLAAVGNLASNTVTVLSLNSTTNTNTTSTIQIPQGIALDPCPASTCNANAEFVPNPNFLITASLQNQVEILDPTTGILTPFRVGINPTALAYNFASSTMVTLNRLSQTMTVVDFLSRQVRAVFPVAPSSEFGVDIHPQTNLAVVADPTNSRVLLLPLPQ